MRNILCYVTALYASVSVLTGIFANQFISLEGINIGRIPEVRWTLITIWPVVLMVNFVWLGSPPAKDIVDMLLRFFGQTALFVVPYFWVFNHA